uniref:Uncharacterized protein n=1 Tax=Arundo donax TaxID=35708 RepID=A0A0A8YC39_ARUDO
MPLEANTIGRPKCPWKQIQFCSNSAKMLPKFCSYSTKMLSKFPSHFKTIVQKKGQISRGIEKVYMVK